MNDNNFRGLKIMVIGMGIFLMFGVVALIYLIHERNQSPGRSPAAESQENQCSGGALHLDAGEIKTMNEYDGLLFLHIATPDKAAEKVVIFDYCTGKALSTVELGK
jgi:hypothetical protein